MNFIIKPLALVLVTAALAGCVVRPVGHGRAVLAPSPGLVGAVVATAIAASIIGGVTYVNTAPPPVVYENYGSPPAVGMIWTPGYHHWSGSGYVWRSGSWARPPQGRSHYVPGHWNRHHSHGHHYVPGHWR